MNNSTRLLAAQRPRRSMRNHPCAPGPLRAVINALALMLIASSIVFLVYAAAIAVAGGVR